MMEKTSARKANGAVSRRDFMGTTAGCAGGCRGCAQTRPSVVRTTPPPSEKLNIAGVGVGGMGQNNVNACATENIVALCDVDSGYAAGVFKKYPKARTWTDYREMLDEQKDIDAVVIATPDHAHAVIAMAAMERGKHVYVQKPLTRTVYEARKLTEARSQVQGRYADGQPGSFL